MIHSYDYCDDVDEEKKLQTSYFFSPLLRRSLPVIQPYKDYIVLHQDQ